MGMAGGAIVRAVSLADRHVLDPWVGVADRHADMSGADLRVPQDSPGPACGRFGGGNDVGVLLVLVPTLATLDLAVKDRTGQPDSEMTPVLGWLQRAGHLVRTGCEDMSPGFDQV